MNMKFRKKPVEVEAEQFLIKTERLFSGTKIIEINIPNGVIKKKFEDYQDKEPYYKYGVETLEGFMECKNKDYIITGVQGEKYPCKPDIFEKTYEKVEE